MLEDWGLLVRRFRIEHGLTQERMGDMFGVSQRTISRWERSESQPSLQRRRRLRDLGWERSEAISDTVVASVRHAAFPGGLSRVRNVPLRALSGRRGGARQSLAREQSLPSTNGKRLASIGAGRTQVLGLKGGIRRSIPRRHPQLLTFAHAPLLSGKAQAEMLAVSYEDYCGLIAKTLPLLLSGPHALHRFHHQFARTLGLSQVQMRRLAHRHPKALVSNTAVALERSMAELAFVAWHLAQGRYRRQARP